MEMVHRHKTKGDGLAMVALWQFMVFMMFILMIWLNEIMDLSALWFGTAPSEFNAFRGCVLTATALIMAIITVGHTYVQQKQIIRGLLTVCAECRKIRMDEEVWEQLDQYISDHSLALISHGLCPSCFARMQKEIGEMGLDKASGKTV
jgi:hypothetical protein